MARARNIKPGFFKNEVLGVADPLLSLLFEGLWVLADREGRLEDRPLRIQGEVFPYRPGIDMDGMLDWLQDNGFIRRYVASGKRCILVLEFVKHQNPHKNESASELPAPDGFGTKPEIIGSTRAESLSSDSLIPSSLIADNAADAAPPGKKRKLPADFCVSDRVRGWAKERGYERIDEHFEAFCAKCRAKSYAYVDWDSALMEAVREDWAKLRGRGVGGAVPAAEASTVPMNPKALYKPEPKLTPEQLAANKENAAKQLAALKAGGLKAIQRMAA